MRYYARSWESVLNILRTSHKGLSEEQIKERKEKFGFNEIVQASKTTVFKIILNQFKNILLMLLVFAALLSFFVGEHLDAYAIVGIIALSVILGFIQEYRAEKAVALLKKSSAPTARVIRDGKQTKIPAKFLVPGDIVLLEAGDIVPADMRLFQTASLQADESSLTGESVPSEKITQTMKAGISAADQENMVFMGTIITYGKGRGVVTGIGMKTELGKVAESIQETEETETPLQRKFSKLAKQIGVLVLGLISVVFVIGVMQGNSITTMFIFALSLSVAAVPSSLPVIVTIGLSMGSRKLAQQKMIIKKLPAAESLGSVTIICSDKTGTLTKNQMTVTKIFTNKQVMEVTGTGYNPLGKFFAGDEEINPEKLELIFRIGFLCNNAKLTEKDGAYSILGDPTEGALRVLGKKGNLKTAQFTLLHELPFDSDRKIMTVVYKNHLNNKKEAYLKGAPDLILKQCTKIIENGRTRTLTKEDRIKILEKNNQFANDALRVLGMAYREVDHDKYTIKNTEKDLIFVGLTGMIDPPREEIKYALEDCHNAGIRVMMITGDHPTTAKAIAKQIGLFKRGDLVLRGEDIEHMTDKELESKIHHIRIIARALPIQKLRVVEALQKNGHIVAMTGDGVNDAPALKKADIGIAMGITGTDVAKEVSKAILVDDNFATIVNAVNEGRNIYDKMLKSARYLLSCNAGEVMTVFIAILLSFPLPLIPLQILLMNILTDNFPALGLGFEPSDKSAMKRPPRDPDANPLSKGMILNIVIFGIIMGLGTLFLFVQYKDIDLIKAQTVAFTTLVMFEMFAVISSRSLYPSLKKLNPFTNLWLMGGIGLSLTIQAFVIYWQPLQEIFGTTALAGTDLLKIIGVAFLGFIFMEASKFLTKKNIFKARGTA